jgi:nucleoside recognition membrane protein YjiH
MMAVVSNSARVDGTIMDSLSPWWRRVVAEVIDLTVVAVIANGLLLVIGGHTVIKFVLLGLIGALPVIGLVVGEIAFWADGLWPLWDMENRALHDMLAHTRVVRV